MPNPMKTLLPLAAGLVLGTWFAKRPVPPQARTLCPPAGQAGIRRQMEQLKREYEKQDRMRPASWAWVSRAWAAFWSSMPLLGSVPMFSRPTRGFSMPRNRRA